jgi:hypothetical protein
MGEHRAGRPVLMKPLSWKSSAAPDCGQLSTDHLGQLQSTSGTTCLVAARRSPRRGRSGPPVSRRPCATPRWSAPRPIHRRWLPSRRAIARTWGDRAMVASSTAGCSAPQHRALWTNSCCSPVRRKSTCASNCAARPEPVPPLCNRPWRPLRRACRPPSRPSERPPHPTRWQARAPRPRHPT